MRPRLKPRRYHSPSRAAQADATRARLLAAARRHFARHGYARASLDRIAEEAGVSVQRLYAVFGSKPALLMALIRALKDEVGVNERARALLDDPDPSRKLAAVASLTRTYCEHGLVVLTAASEAARGDRAVHRVWTEVERWRHAGNAAVVRGLSRQGALRPGLSRKEATDVLWALTAHNLYELYVDARGWSRDRYERWLGRALAEALLR